VELIVLHPATSSPWQVLPGRESTTAELAPTDTLSLAVDLGTTHIRASLWVPQTGRCLGGRVGDNPQQNWGSDVLCRLVEAGSTPATRALMRARVRAAIGEVLATLCDAAACATERVTRVHIVGNTAMLLLVGDGEPAELIDVDGWSRAVDCPLTDPGALAQRWHLAPDARVALEPPVQGFVGSDLLAAALHTRMADAAPGTVLIDFGTNSEIALWDGERLWVTAAAGGPSFEASGISCGMPAEPGAVTAIERDANGQRTARVLGDVPARGLCGSGLVSAIATLVDAGLLRPNGRFARDVLQPVAVAANASELALDARDVDAFQRAKAAVGAGVACLCARASHVQPRELVLCGAFGHHLDPWAATRVGLVPSVDDDAVAVFAEAALAGCEQLCVDPTAAQDLVRLRALIASVNLGTDPSYDQHFVDQLLLKPLNLSRRPSATAEPGFRELPC